MNAFQIIISTIFVNNYVFSQFLGICPFLGVSSKVETATGMAAAVTFVVTIASVITWGIQKAILDVYNLQYLQTIVFILVIASLVQFVEMVIKKLSPALYQAMGVFLPLITTNCMVLGVAIIYPSPFANPSTIDGKGVFFDAKLSALAKIKQLTTIKGINSPSDA